MGPHGCIHGVPFMFGARPVYTGTRALPAAEGIGREGAVGAEGKFGADGGSFTSFFRFVLLKAASSNHS